MQNSRIKVLLFAHFPSTGLHPYFNFFLVDVFLT